MNSKHAISKSTKVIEQKCNTIQRRKIKEKERNNNQSSELSRSQSAELQLESVWLLCKQPGAQKFKRYKSLCSRCTQSKHREGHVVQGRSPFPPFPIKSSGTLYQLPPLRKTSSIQFLQSKNKPGMKRKTVFWALIQSYDVILVEDLDYYELSIHSSISLDVCPLWKAKMVQSVSFHFILVVLKHNSTLQKRKKKKKVHTLQTRFHQDCSYGNHFSF